MIKRVVKIRNCSSIIEFEPESVLITTVGGNLTNVSKNASIDWTIKESVKAKLKVIVKRSLRQYGYPQDMQ